MKKLLWLILLVACVNYSAAQTNAPDPSEIEYVNYKPRIEIVCYDNDFMCPYIIPFAKHANANYGTNIDIEYVSVERAKNIKEAYPKRPSDSIIRINGNWADAMAVCVAVEKEWGYYVRDLNPEDKDYCFDFIDLYYHNKSFEK